MAFTLEPLPYSYEALEPYLDGRTLKIHYTKHHDKYCQQLNEAIQGTKYESITIEEILRHGAKELPETVRNNGGGYANHLFFWRIMKPKGEGKPTGKLAEAIDSQFDSFKQFQESFSEKAKKHFGSGWAWLVMNKGTLEIISTPNQDSPLMEKKIPLLGLDVWEHAYYLQYQNERPKYIAAWWHVVNWTQVAEHFAKGQAK